MYFNLLTDITGSDIMLDINLHIIPVVLLTDVL